MEMGLKCKIPWCQAIVKDEKDEKDKHLEKHPVDDFFMTVKQAEWNKKMNELSERTELRCRYCLNSLKDNETPKDHIRKHPTADLFDAVAIPKWE